MVTVQKNKSNNLLINMSKQKIVIVGGGTSGWMTAAYLSKKTNWDITLIQSQDIPIVGVGESTLPSLYNFIQECGLTEDDLFEHSNAIRKYTIRHKDWNTQGDWFHHFCFNESEEAEQNHWMENGIRPTKDWRHAYHIDAFKFGAMLRDKVAIPNGVVVENKTIDSVNDIDADLVIDCTGFNKLTKPTNWVDSVLPNNRAVICPSNQVINKPYTQTTALSAGWMWTIALQNRTSNAYVFSDKHLTDEQAKEEFINSCKYDLDLDKLRFLSWTGGYTTTPRRGNVLNIGLSAGFFEPLESQAIWATQYQVEMLVRLGLDKQTVYNKQWVIMMKHIERYLLAHYTANKRRDNAYWQQFDTLNEVSSGKNKFTIFGEYSYRCLANGYALPYNEQH